MGGRVGGSGGGGSVGSGVGGTVGAGVHWVHCCGLLGCTSWALGCTVRSLGGLQLLGAVSELGQRPPQAAGPLPTPGSTHGGSAGTVTSSPTVTAGAAAGPPSPAATTAPPVPPSLCPPPHPNPNGSPFTQPLLVRLSSPPVSHCPSLAVHLPCCPPLPPASPSCPTVSPQTCLCPSVHPWGQDAVGQTPDTRSASSAPLGAPPARGQTLTKVMRGASCPCHLPDGPFPPGHVATWPQVLRGRVTSAGGQVDIRDSAVVAVVSLRSQGVGSRVPSSHRVPVTAPGTR